MVSMNDLVDSVHERLELIFRPSERLVFDHGTVKSRRSTRVSSNVGEKRLEERREGSLHVSRLVGVGERNSRTSWDDVDGDLFSEHALFDVRESLIVEDSFNVVVSGRETEGRDQHEPRRTTKEELTRSTSDSSKVARQQP